MSDRDKARRLWTELRDRSEAQALEPVRAFQAMCPPPNAHMRRVAYEQLRWSRLARAYDRAAMAYLLCAVGSAVLIVLFIAREWLRS